MLSFVKSKTLKGVLETRCLSSNMVGSPEFENGTISSKAGDPFGEN